MENLNRSSIFALTDAPQVPEMTFNEAAAKYKTEICTNWVSGHCQYGTNCLFAHGDYEMRRKAVPKNYKTKFCINILRTGWCPYGTRCQFLHKEDGPDTAPGSPQGSREVSVERRPVFIDLERRCI